MKAATPRMTRAVLIILAVSLSLPSLALLYLIAQNPFEFALPYCDSPGISDWRDVIYQGCLDLGYVAKFLAVYGAVVLGLAIAAYGLIRLLERSH